MLSRIAGGCISLCALVFWGWIPPVRAQPAAAPSFLFVLVDDMTVDELRFMPRTQAHFAMNGTRLSYAFVTQAICCPSRVSFLTGQYTKNHGVISNTAPAGGFAGFVSRGLETQTYAYHLQKAGWFTGYVGKFLNGYGGDKVNVPPTYVPPGWSEWYAFSGTLSYYNYRLNENGRLRTYGSAPEDYATDVFAAHARRFLNDALQRPQAFLLTVAPFAPHVDAGSAIPAPRHAKLFSGLTAPRAASFNQVDVSAKPRSVRSKPLLSDLDIAWIDERFRRRVQSLQAVDEMMGELLAVLAAHPRGVETVVIFASDNGYFFGEHRLRGKGGLYDQSTRVPMMFSGPGVSAGAVRRELVNNTDIFPTLLTWAGLEAPAATADGRSLLPLLAASGRAAPFERQSFLVETQQTGRNALHTASYLYAETPNSAGRVFVELYDTLRDPDLVYNIAGRLTPASASALATALASLRQCARSTCRDRENQWSDALVELVSH